MHELMNLKLILMNEIFILLMVFRISQRKPSMINKSEFSEHESIQHNFTIKRHSRMRNVMNTSMEATLPKLNPAIARIRNELIPKKIYIKKKILFTRRLSIS